MPRPLSVSELRELARHGANARIQELESQIAAIRAAFPGSGGSRPGRKQARAALRPTARKRGRMSAAARKAASIRMKKYWAARRKAK